MAGVITTSQFAQAVRPLTVKMFGAEYADALGIWKQMFNVENISKSYIEETLTSGLGLAQYTAESEEAHYDSASQGWTVRYQPLKYTNGFLISQELIEDGDGEAMAMLKTKALKRGFLETQEILAANVYNRAFNSSYVGGDGKELCNAVHPLKSGGTFSNVITGNPDFSESALEAALIQIKDVRDERGLKANLKAVKLIIPDALEYDVERFLGNDMRAATADRDINAVNKLGKLPSGSLVNTYLTDSDAWFIVTNCENGMKAVIRKDMSMAEDNDFDTDNAKFKASMRLKFGWSNPRAVFGSQGT